jgi:hypothetical protein
LGYFSRNAIIAKKAFFQTSDNKIFSYYFDFAFLLIDAVLASRVILAITKSKKSRSAMNDFYLRLSVFAQNPL